MSPRQSSPFHQGEQQVQDRLGVRESIEPWAARVIRPCLPDQHREFYTGLPFLVAAARDNEGRPWATLLAGRPGFVQSPDRSSLVISTSLAPGDALQGRLNNDRDIGLLGIDLATRRRNRANGRVEQKGDKLRIAIDQSFGNCPQYIHERAWHWVESNESGEPLPTKDQLQPANCDLISQADTLFIASGYRGEGHDSRFGMDASHRGGHPGFVRVADDRQLVFPDYAGNNHYNTIGNLVMDARVGLLFVDFSCGSLLQITGRTRIDWDSEQLSEYPGAQRLVIIDIDKVVNLPNALPIRWSAPRGAVRSLRVIDKVQESADVTSFYLGSRDGGPLPDFEAGQHLPVEIRIPEHDVPLQRTYSLSNAPQDDYFRISVKRETHGAVSRFLHDSVNTGQMIESSSPAGDFILAPGSKPVVLVSAGVGITPMMSMLYQLAEGQASRPVWFVHAARDGQHHAFADEVQCLAAPNTEIHTHIRYSQPAEEDIQGTHYDSEGHVDGDLISRLLGTMDAVFYLCGPPGFLANLGTQLVQLGAVPNQVFTEAF